MYGSVVGFYAIDAPFVGDEVHLSLKHDGRLMKPLCVHNYIKAMDVATHVLFVVFMLGGACQGDIHDVVFAKKFFDNPHNRSL